MDPRRLAVFISWEGQASFDSNEPKGRRKARYDHEPIKFTK